MSDLLNSASLVMIPSGYKEDVVYSQIPTDGSGDLSFTRASNGTRVNSAGLVEVCPWNFVAQSENIGTSPWLTNGATLTSGQTDPSGGTTAVKIQLASGGNNYVYQGITIPQGTNIVSAYLRADSATTIGFSMGGSTPNSVNLTTTWQLFTFSSADTSGGIIFDNYFGPSPTQQAKTFYIWHPQFNIGSTAKPYFPTTDRLNVPRLTYQNGGGGCPSLLLEKQSTNLVTYSEQFDNAAWSKAANNATLVVTQNYGVSPDGTQNADRIQMTQTAGSSNYSQIYQLVNVTSGNTYTWSVWLKSLSGTPTVGWAYDGANWSVITLTTEWQRYTITKTAQSTSINSDVLLYGAISTSLSADFLMWGYQIEASSYPTSYIPTTSSSATRVADACYKTGISSLIGQTEGTIFIDVSGPSKTGDARYIGVSNGSDSNRILLYSSNLNTVSLYWQSPSGSGQLNFTAINGRMKMAAGYKNNDFVVYCNGVLQTSTTSAPISMTLNTLFVGTYENITIPNSLDQSINEALVFKTRLTNAELASLTTI